MKILNETALNAFTKSIMITEMVEGNMGKMANIQD